MARFFKKKKSEPKFEKLKLKARCKMCVTRLNMKKQKTKLQITVLKREIAGLLTQNKDESARIKVEAVIRNEFLCEAIDIIQMFIDLVVTRIQMIHEMKRCPPDLKEAIATLIYVAPRIDNVPELTAVRDQFVLKYGKPFVTDHTHNKDLAVNKRVLAKMSVSVPEPTLCISYLKVIAKEANVEWGEREDSTMMLTLGSMPPSSGNSSHLPPPPTLQQQYNPQSYHQQPQHQFQQPPSTSNYQPPPQQQYQQPPPTHNYIYGAPPPTQQQPQPPQHEFHPPPTTGNENLNQVTTSTSYSQPPPVLPTVGTGSNTTSTEEPFSSHVDPEQQKLVPEVKEEEVKPDVSFDFDELQKRFNNLQE